MPAQAPMTMRRAISCQADVATRARSDARQNRPSPNCTVRRAPSRAWHQAASSRPAVMAARNPVESHCASGRPMPKSAMIAGNATLILVEARIIAMLPSISRPSSHCG